MATRSLTVALSEETIRLIEAAVASGDFSDPADVLQAAVERLCTTEEDFDDWIRREAIPVLEEMEADPSSGFTLEQILADIGEQESRKLPKAS